MLHCWAQIDAFLLGQIILGLTGIVPKDKHEKMGKSDCLEFKGIGHFVIQKFKCANISLNLFYFSGILCDDMHSRGSKGDCIFIFQGNFELLIFWYKIEMLKDSCFITLLFLGFRLAGSLSRL